MPDRIPGDAFYDMVLKNSAGRKFDWRRWKSVGRQSDMAVLIGEADCQKSLYGMTLMIDVKL
jgi:hypothetical protein